MTNKDKEYDKFKYLLTNTYTLCDAEKEVQAFKDKIKPFSKITSIAAAKKMAKELFYIEQDINYIKITDDAMCLIVQTAELFRLCVEDDKEFICYSITKAKK